MPEEIITGKAENAKGGAVVVTNEGDVTYIMGFDSWDSDVVGNEVVVKGHLSSEKYIPDYVVDEDGGISQGAEGMQTVLYNAEWKLK